jgi:hypothetical protein
LAPFAPECAMLASPRAVAGTDHIIEERHGNHEEACKP